jgi:AbrB family looped-hinge helix DNA binding protein
MSSTIISTIDTAGRLVLPKEICEEAQLKPGMPLQISVSDGRVEIEPAPREVRIVRKGRVSVAVPVEPGEPLTLATVNETIDRLRNGER